MVRGVEPDRVTVMIALAFRSCAEVTVAWEMALVTSVEAVLLAVLAAE